MFAVITDMMETGTILEQLRLKLCKNLRTTDGAWQKFTGSYKKKSVYCHFGNHLFKICVNDIQNLPKMNRFFLRK